MADCIEVKTLNGVVVQENGIIRNAKGYLIGRLVSDVGFESEHLTTNHDGDVSHEIMSKEIKGEGVSVRYNKRLFGECANVNKQIDFEDYDTQIINRLIEEWGVTNVTSEIQCCVIFVLCELTKIFNRKGGDCELD